MAKRIRYLSLGLLVIFGLPSTSAQETIQLFELDFYVVSGSRIRNVRFGSFDEMGTMVGSHRTGFRSSGRSLKYTYSGPYPIVFFEETESPTPDDPARVIRTPVARVRPPIDKNELLFLFSRTQQEESSGDKYTIDWVLTDQESIPAGHITIYNTLPIDFTGVVQMNGGKDNLQAITASPGLNAPINIHPKAKVILALNSEEHGILRSYEDVIHCGPDERILLVLFPPRFPGSYKVGSKIISLPVSSKEKVQDTSTESSDENKPIQESVN